MTGNNKGGKTGVRTSAGPPSLLAPGHTPGLVWQIEVRPAGDRGLKPVVLMGLNMGIDFREIGSPRLIAWVKCPQKLNVNLVAHNDNDFAQMRIAA